MATLVLSTVGTALGGPIGSAIGALVGQSIDQALLAPKSRGPRVGDLTVQTSSYGTQVPRIYGSMRVAGSVIWSTELTESTQTAGAKGQPDVTYSYSVSMAVALSSRAVKSIGRIWADGKLLRGAAGDFKVETGFRFYDGDEDQVIDPLIASIEGIGNTPAYRGLSLAVFEELQLAEFGNRIPFLTFEVLADEELPTIGSVLTDASAGTVISDADAAVVGFAAYGASVKSAIAPLVECFCVELFDDGAKLRPPHSDVAAIGEAEFGNGVAKEKAPRLQREQTPAHALPSALRLTYYDAARDYQTGEARAAVSEPNGNEVQQELAAVLEAPAAKALAQEMLARAWARRDKLTLRLPPSRITLEPGAKVELPLNPVHWTVDKTTVDGFVTVAELYPSLQSAPAVPADGGRIVRSPDVSVAPLSLALFDLPNATGASSADPIVLLAASTAGVGWKRRFVDIEFGGQSRAVEVPAEKSVMGTAVSVLAPGGVDILDEEQGLDIQLTDPDQWLVSCDDQALAAGANLAALGSELLQFGGATPLGGGSFRLSRLLRGRGGTEWACGGHAVGDSFCLIGPGGTRAIVLPTWSAGAMMTAKSGESATSIAFSAENLRPPSPVDLRAARMPTGELSISWIRRSRQGFAWIDGIDAPLGETRESYRVSILGSSGSIEREADVSAIIIAAMDLIALGAGAATIEVRQIGDYGPSRPASMIIILA